MVAFGGLVLHYETQFAASALQLMEDEKQRDKTAATVTGDAPGGWALVSPGIPGSLSHVTVIIYSYSGLISYTAVNIVCIHWCSICPSMPS